MAKFIASFWPNRREGAQGPTTTQLAHLIFAIVATQILFWGLVLGATALSPLNDANTQRYEVKQFATNQARSLDDPTPIQSWKIPRPTNWLELHADTPGLYRFNLIVKERAQGAGVFVALVRDNATLYVNGVFLGPPETGDWMARPGLLGLHFIVPPSLLREGDNEMILLVNRNSHFTRLGQVFAGDAHAVEDIAHAIDLTKTTLPIIAVTISAMLAMVALALIPLFNDRVFLLSALATALSIAAGTLFYLDNGAATSHIFWLWYGNILGAIGGYLAFLCMITAWIGGPKWVYRKSGIAFAIIAVSTAIMSPFLVYEAVSYMLMACVTLVMAVVLPLSFVGLARMAWSPNRGDHWLAAALLISPITAFVDLILSIMGEPQVVYFAPLSNLTLLIGISLALARRGGVLYRESELANLTLTHRIAVKEAELEASAQALRAQEAETVIQTERARIMRDMHDGMGGQLLNLLMQTRDPDAKLEELEETVETAIADLRLLIDSLDSVGDDLEIALALFKERLGPRLASARVLLDWPNTPMQLQRQLSPAEILSIYRILQEVISNALRHGGPTRIEVRQSYVDGIVSLILDDDGNGMKSDAQAGRGLSNMRRRAQEIGGSFTVEAGPLGGVRARLNVPVA